MPAKVPPLGSVRAFEAAARHLSFTKAARELGITQAAVSWQIRSLEQRLGLTLFTRGKTGLALTPAGGELAPGVTEALEQLSRVFAEVLPAGDKVSISVTPTFVHCWLAPRLGRFRERHPHIAVEIDAGTQVAQLGNGGPDLAIRRGGGGWPGLAARRLMPVTLAPVCAPGLVAAFRHPLKVEDLWKLPLLQPLSLWRKWLAALGEPAPADPRRAGVSYPRQHLAIQAAMSGDGVALANPAFCADALAGGRLVLAGSARVTLEKEGYWLVHPSQARLSKSAAAFCEWIDQELESRTGGPGP